MSEQIKPQKVLFTVKLLDSIRFENRVIGVNPDGSTITIPLGEKQTDWFLWDSDLQGFGVRVTGKKKQFYAQRKLGGVPCRFQCGVYPGTSLTKAKNTAVAALAMMKLGQDPNLEKKKAIAEVKAERAKARDTVGRMYASDALTQSETDATSTKRDRLDVQKWIEDMPVWRTSIHELTPDILNDMMRAVREKRGDATAVKVWRYLRAAWNRLDSTEQPDRDPFDDWLKKHQLPVIKRRQTVLHTDDDSGQSWLKAIASMRTLAGGRNYAKRVMADYIIVTLCWGARRSEAASIKVTDVDFEREYVVFRDTKNSRDHYFPLTPAVASILRQRIEENNIPRGRDVRRAQRGEETYVPEWVFPSPKRGIHLVEPRAALDLGQAAAGTRITMHDLRRGFAGEVAADAVVDADGNAKGDFGLVKVAMNHSDMKSDVTQGYIMIKPRLKMLRPLYLAHERRVFKAAGLDEFLPAEKSEVDQALAILKKSIGDNPDALKKLLASLQE